MKQRVFEIPAYSFLIGNSPASRRVSRITEPLLSSVTWAERNPAKTNCLLLALLFVLSLIQS